MTANSEEKVENPGNTIKEKCVKCLKGPNLIKTIVIIICIAVVCQQIAVCIKKLIDIPITTYTHFDFNKTIMYPSLTFCREPPYKFDKLLEYGLHGHPRFTSTWRDFNFSHVSLDQLWEDITYNHTDFFVQYGLDNLMENVNLKATFGFALGRCYTISPLLLNTRATKSSGYSVTLKHSSADIATSISTYPPGYHVYIHYTREPYTEVEVYNGGLVDYLYVNMGETIDVKLTVDQYFKISSEDEPCTNRQNYSANHCTSKFVWDLVGEEAGCSGPWMISDLPHCDNYTTMRSLISAYMNTYQDHNCSICPRFCQSYLYNAFVMDRQIGYGWDSALKQWNVKTGDAALETQLYIHFNAMMVSVYEERYNYDWNLFVSDLGGSVGFLLGLSVIGLMSIFGKFWSIVVIPFFAPSKRSKDATSVTGSTATVDVEAVSKEQEYIQSCKEWNIRIIGNDK